MGYRVWVLRVKKPTWRIMILGWTVLTRRQTIIYDFYESPAKNSTSALFHQYFMFSFSKRGPLQWIIGQSIQNSRNSFCSLLKNAVKSYECNMHGQNKVRRCIPSDYETDQHVKKIRWKSGTNYLSLYICMIENIYVQHKFLPKNKIL